MNCCGQQAQAKTTPAREGKRDTNYKRGLLATGIRSLNMPLKGSPEENSEEARNVGRNTRPTCEGTPANFEVSGKRRPPVEYVVEPMPCVNI